MDDMVHGRYRNFGLSNFEIRIVHVLSENKRTHKFSALRRGRARSTAVRLLYQCRMARDSSSITRCGPSGSSGRRSVATNSRSLIARRVAGSRTLESPPRDVPPRHSRGRAPPADSTGRRGPRRPRRRRTDRPPRPAAGTRRPRSTRTATGAVRRRRRRRRSATAPGTTRAASTRNLEVAVLPSVRRHARAHARVVSLPLTKSPRVG